MQQHTTSYQYIIKSGDTLNTITQKMYGIPPADKQFPAAKAFLLSLNPQIKHPDRISAGHILRIDEYSPQQSLPHATASIQAALKNPVISPAAALLAEERATQMCRGAPLPQWQAGPQRNQPSRPGSPLGSNMARTQCQPGDLAWHGIGWLLGAP